jgi:hypothetical protein
VLGSSRTLAGIRPMAQLIPFTSAAKKHRERLTSLTFTPGAGATLLTTGTNSQVKAYPYLRSLWIHVTASGGTAGPAALAADAPWNAITACMIADTNGSALYGSQIFTGWDAYAAHLFSGRADICDPTIYPFYTNSVVAFEFAVRFCLEYNSRTGAGALPNMSANAAYGIFLTGNTSAAIWQTAPSTIPLLTIDVWMECYTLPEAQDLLGRNQMQGPPLLGTTQYTTKQSYSGLTASGANTVALTRKGNMLRKWLLILRNSSVARIAYTLYPNPFEFWWDGNRLTSDDPKYLEALLTEQNAGMLQASSVISVPTGLLPYEWSAPYEVNYGGDGEGGWLATTQSSRLELVGSNWGSGVAQLDVITLDVAPIALANQYALDSNSGKLLYPAQPETR